MYEEILSFEKEKAEGYLYLAVTYLHKKDYAKAEAVLRDALSRFENDDDLNFNLAIALDKTKRFDEMVQYLKRAIEINPKHADALNYLGYSYAERGIHLDEAYLLVTRALEIKPDNGYIMDSLGWVYFKSGKYDEALKTLLRAAEIVKDDPTVLEHIGDVYNALGFKEEAKEYWTRSVEFQKKGEDEDLRERVERKLKGVGSGGGETH